MKSLALEAFPRVATKRNAVKKLRTSGRVPGVLYGREGSPKSVEVDVKALKNLVHHSTSETVLVDLALEGKSQLALLQEVQHHPISNAYLHVDLRAVRADEKVIISVPVEAVGEPVGVKTGGGVLEHVMFKLKVRALPKDLPEIIHVDVSLLDLEQSIHIGDIKPGAGVEILGIPGLAVFSVAVPKAEVEKVAEVVAVEGAAAPAADGAKAEGAAPVAGDAKKGDAKKGDAKKGDAKKPEAKKPEAKAKGK